MTGRERSASDVEAQAKRPYDEVGSELDYDDDVDEDERIKRYARAALGQPRIPQRDDDTDDAWTQLRDIDARLARIPRGDAHSFDPDTPDPMPLLRTRAQIVEWYGEPPGDWEPPVIKQGAKAQEVKGPRRLSFEDVLATRLTLAEADHWQRLQSREKQKVIAAALGISQPAVVKRERALRTKVDAIYQEHFGRPYPWATVSDGGRRRRL